MDIIIKNIDDLNQFDKLLILGKLKKIFKNCDIEIYEREQAPPQQPIKQLQQTDVISPVCSICGGKGSYSFGGSFGGSISTVRCNCGANGL